MWAKALKWKKEERHDVIFDILGDVQPDEAELLEGSTDKVVLVSGWITIALTEFSNRGWFAQDPALTSRVYQDILHGMTAYKKALMIAVVPFPFCFVQMLHVLLYVFICSCPLMVIVFTSSASTAAVMTFCTIVGYWGINGIAAELENPYGEELNDLPLEEMNADFVDTIRCLHNRSVPELGAKLSPSVVMKNFCYTIGVEAYGA